MPDRLRTRAWSAPWQELLCRRYVAVFFCGAEPPGKDGSPWPPALSWAVGALGNGEVAVIGVRAEGASGVTVWSRAFADLKARGLERIRFAVANDLTAFGEDLQTQFPGASPLPSFARLLDRSVRQVQPRDRAPVKEHLLAILQASSNQAVLQSLAEFESSRWAARYPALVTHWRLALDQGGPLWSLEPTLRREVLRGDARATSLHLSVGKALARHGGFADPGAALSFVQAVLVRARRRFDAAESTATSAHRPLREGSPFRGVALGG
jgi:transposase-like protein